MKISKTCDTVNRVIKNCCKLLVVFSLGLLFSLADASAQTASYMITFKTADELYAGTDSNIFLTLYGVTGKSREIRMNPLMDGNVFERNETDSVEIGQEVRQDLGAISSIRLRSGGDYDGDWRCEYIEVTYVSPQNRVHFQKAMREFSQTRDATMYYMKINELNQQYAVTTRFDVDRKFTGDERFADNGTDRQGAYFTASNIKASPVGNAVVAYPEITKCKFRDLVGSGQGTEEEESISLSVSKEVYFGSEKMDSSSLELGFEAGMDGVEANYGAAFKLSARKAYESASSTTNSETSASTFENSKSFTLKAAPNTVQIRVAKFPVNVKSQRYTSVFGEFSANAATGIQDPLISDFTLRPNEQTRNDSLWNNEIRLAFYRSYPGQYDQIVSTLIRKNVLRNPQPIPANVRTNLTKLAN